MLYSCAKLLLFTQDPESVHARAMRALESPLLCRWLKIVMGAAPRRPVELWGLKFRNCVGLAAGFDKNGTALAAWEAFGFGFVEVGTATPAFQSGNPQPRLFRFPAQRALVNSMGFPNDGVRGIAARLAAFKRTGAPRDMPVGLNIGRQRSTRNEEAVRDYLACLREGWEAADYFALNVSSPNTPGLRQLQSAEVLSRLLVTVRTERDQRAGGGPRKPLLVKVSPDLDDAGLAEVAGAVLASGIDGIIAGNTTLDHTALKVRVPLAGGLSGAPLRKASTRAVRRLHAEVGGRVPIIGCGGVFSREDVKEKLDAGASLVQLYTGFVFLGPRTVWRLVG